jgi:hypothetical protein
MKSGCAAMERRRREVARGWKGDWGWKKDGGPRRRHYGATDEDGDRKVWRYEA